MALFDWFKRKPVEPVTAASPDVQQTRVNNTHLVVGPCVVHAVIGNGLRVHSATVEMLDGQKLAMTLDVKPGQFVNMYSVPFNNLVVRAISNDVTIVWQRKS